MLYEVITILAMFPVLAGAEGAHRLFNVVFFVVFDHDHGVAYVAKVFKNAHQPVGVARIVITSYSIHYTKLYDAT